MECLCRLTVMSNKRKEEKIQRLDTEIRINGHVYKLHLRSENVATYKQFTKEGQLVAYELFKIKIRAPETIGGVEYPLREVFCSNSDFGVSAFSLRFNSTEEQIKERMDSLQAAYDERENLKLSKEGKHE